MPAYFYSFEINKLMYPHARRGPCYMMVWWSVIVCILILPYAKRLFPDSNPWLTSHQGATLLLQQSSPSVLKSIHFYFYWCFETIKEKKGFLFFSCWISLQINWLKGYCSFWKYDCVLGKRLVACHRHTLHLVWMSKVEVS